MARALVSTAWAPLSAWVVLLTEGAVRDLVVEEFLDRLAGRTPVPGGGACAGLLAAQGAALLAMVARYSDGPRCAAGAGVVGRVLAEADRLRGQALTLAAEDAVAFEAVARAYRLPAGTGEQAGVRAAAVAEALVGAAVPQADLVGVAGRVVVLAEELLAVCNPNLVADVAAAVESARAAAAVAGVNVRVNVVGVAGERERERFSRVLARVDEVVAGAGRVSAAVLARVGGR